MMFSLHAVAALASSLLAFLAARNTWIHYKETSSEPVRYLALDFFSVSLAMLLLVPPAALFSSDLLPPFLAFSVFFLYLGVAFFLRLVVGLFGKMARFSFPVFLFTLGTGATLGVITFLSGPTLTFQEEGLVTAYHFSPLVKAFLALFIILYTSVLSGLVFLRQAMFVPVFATKLRSFLFGAALLFIGTGVLLVILEEGVWYNFFIVVAFLLFYASVKLRSSEQHGRF